jgi:hypothetical protein
VASTRSGCRGTRSLSPIASSDQIGKDRHGAGNGTGPGGLKFAAADRRRGEANGSDARVGHAMLRWLFIIFLIADGLVEVAIRSPKLNLSCRVDCGLITSYSIDLLRLRS